MTSQDVLKALHLLRPVSSGVAALSELPGLDQVEITLLQQMAGSAMLFLRRMDARAQGLPMARVCQEMQETALLLCAEPNTEKVQ